MNRLKRALSILLTLIGLFGPPLVLVYSVNRINEERAANIRTSCLAQNRRHDSTIHTLNMLIARIKRKRPAQYARAREGRAGTVLLINALAPKRDCSRLVSDQVNP